MRRGCRCGCTSDWRQGSVREVTAPIANERDPSRASEAATVLQRRRRQGRGSRGGSLLRTGGLDAIRSSSGTRLRAELHGSVVQPRSATLPAHSGLSVEEQSCERADARLFCSGKSAFHDRFGTDRADQLPVRNGIRGPAPIPLGSPRNKHPLAAPDRSCERCRPGAAGPQRRMVTALTSRSVGGSRG
jgi:hypothetical protein